MAIPCVITFRGKQYSFAEFAAKLHEGLLDELIKEGGVKGEGLKYKATEEIKQPAPSQFKYGGHFIQPVLQPMNK